YVLDRAGRYMLVSEGAANVLGLRREEVLGRTWRDLGLPGDVMRPVDEQRERILASGQAEFREVRYPTPDGPRNFEYSMTPVRGEHGTPEWLVAVSRDVTARKRLEERERLLAQAGSILGSSLDYEVTLSQVSELVVPGFADWCGLDLLTDD